MRPNEKRKRVVEAVRPEASAARRLASRIWELAEPPFRLIKRGILGPDVSYPGRGNGLAQLIEHRFGGIKRHDALKQAGERDGQRAAAGTDVEER